MMFKRLLRNRKGTAEVVGSVMFIIILLFFFTNVYLWHDATTKEMNQQQLERVNSGMTLTHNANGTLTLIDSGGLDIDLSRVWISEESMNGNHMYADIENVRIPAGNQIQISFASQTQKNSDGTIQWNFANNLLTIYYDLPGNAVRIMVMNTLGITTSYVYS
jgi:hypothetical protein